MHTEPQQEHHWLQKLVGVWTSEAEAVTEPGQPPQKLKGSETVRSIGGLWTMAEGRGEMPGGGEAVMFMTLGYDTSRKRYVGTWIGSMMAYLWVYDGELSADGKTLTLSAEGPSMAGDGKLGKYRDVIELKSDDERTLSSYMLGDDGKWQHFMTATYRRQK
jgi:hypothetical protein